MDRDEAIQRIKKALKSRSGKAWSVTGGRGTAWGWIEINAVPARRTWRCRLKEGATMNRPEDYERYDSGQPGGSISPTDAAELAKLLGLDSVHDQGVSVAASTDYRKEYVGRAEGHAFIVEAKPYWD